MISKSLEKYNKSNSTYSHLIVLLCTGIFLGLILALQFKSGVPKQSRFPLDQIEAQRGLLQSYVDQQIALESRLNSLREELSKSQERAESVGGTRLAQELEELRATIGLTEKTGEGVEILLADAISISRDAQEPDSESLVHASDLRDVLNLLFLSGSEGVAINGRRILPIFSVNVVGNTFFIHDFYAFPPFTVTAIGNTDVLGARLKDETLLESIHKRQKAEKIRFTVQKRDALTVPAYTGILRTKFLQPVRGTAPVNAPLNETTR